MCTCDVTTTGINVKNEFRSQKFQETIVPLTFKISQQTTRFTKYVIITLVHNTFM